MKNSTFLSEILIKILDEFRGHQIFWSEYRLVVGPSKLEFWLRFLKNSTWIDSDRQLLKHSDDISSSDNYQEFHGRLIFDHNIDCQSGIPEWNYDRYSWWIPSRFLVHLIGILEEFWRHLVSRQLSRISRSSDSLIRIVVACFEKFWWHLFWS